MQARYWKTTILGGVALSLGLPCAALAPDRSDGVDQRDGAPFESKDESGRFSGFEFERALTVDLWANLDGGLKRGLEAPKNLDLVLTVDTERAHWWHGGQFHFYVLGNDGGDVTGTRVGDLQGVSNIEAHDTIKLYEAWYEQRLAGDRLALLVGLHDYNSEFDALEYAGLFLNSSFGIGPEIAQAGPSIFPTTALAVRAAWYPTESTYVRAAVYDGVPGDAQHGSGTHIQLRASDGTFQALEVGAVGRTHSGHYYKIGLGGWHHTAAFDDPSGRTRDRNHGVYFLAERELFAAAAGDTAVGAFVQIGTADRQYNTVGFYAGAGLTVAGPLPGRTDDVAGFAIAHARAADGLREAIPGVDRAETSFELTYSAALAPWLSVQPNVQYIVNPGLDPTLDDATVVGLRFTLTP